MKHKENFNIFINDGNVLFLHSMIEVGNDIDKFLLQYCSIQGNIIRIENLLYIKEITIENIVSLIGRDIYTTFTQEILNIIVETSSLKL